MVATTLKAPECLDAGKKFDAGKPMMSLIPSAAELELAKVLTFGAEKYGPDNWRRVENAQQRYMDAMLRHVNAYRGGEITDKESGLHHLGHAAACVMFLLELGMAETSEVDLSAALLADAKRSITGLASLYESSGNPSNNR